MARRVAGIAAALAATLLAGPAYGQRVRLEIRPQIGDTIQMQLDQEIEMSGTPAGGAEATPKSMTGWMHVRTRAIPVRRLASGTHVLAITDSVGISPVGGSPLLESARRALQGRRVELRVGLDGAMEVIDTGEHEGDTPPFFGPMPPMLPGRVVSVGDRWMRNLSVPIGAGDDGAARVEANFRLDSLSRNGDIAYITMQGTLSRIGASGVAGGSRRSTGTLSGSLQLDRRLGWITDTHLVLEVRTVITTGAGRSPAQVQMKVTQRLRAMRGS
ncbi:MAG: hypothetical protein ACR2L6_10650 [Gemmatimonadaceae bacterium]